LDFPLDFSVAAVPVIRGHRPRLQQPRYNHGATGFTESLPLWGKHSVNPVNAAGSLGPCSRGRWPRLQWSLVIRGQRPRLQHLAKSAEPIVYRIFTLWEGIN